MNFLSRIFVWWNGATLGTLLTTWLYGSLVGEDEYGNRYYQNKNGSRRWVLYKGTVEASRVPADWHGWMHHTFKEPPTSVPFKTKAWEAAHKPNLTGTEGAYRPDGSLALGGVRPAATGDYQAWEAGIIMQQNSTLETLIGAVVVAVAAGFLFFAYTSTSSGSLSGYELTARLARVDGLAPGTDVRLSGIKVGTVTDLKLDPQRYFVTLHLSVNPEIKIPEDSSLSVTSAGLLGSSYLAIAPGGSDKMLAAGERIKNTQGSIDMQGLISSFVGQGNQSGQK